MCKGVQERLPTSAPLKGYPLLPCGKNSPNNSAPTCQRGWQQYAQNSVIPREKLSLREEKFTRMEMEKTRKKREMKRQRHFKDCSHCSQVALANLQMQIKFCHDKLLINCYNFDLSIRYSTKSHNYLQTRQTRWNAFSCLMPLS